MAGYFFTGNPEVELEAARIKSDRQLRALSQVTGAAGTFLGQMRQSREDELKSRLAEERLQATLGEQAEKAKAESSPSPSSEPGPWSSGESGQPGAPLTDPSALKPVAQDPQAAAPAPTVSPLKRLGLAAQETGLRGLRVLGGMTGLSDPYTPETTGSLHNVARLEGRVAHEGMLNKRIAALQGIAAVSDRPGAVITKGTHGEMDLSEFARRPQAPAYGYGGLWRNDNELIAAANAGDPTALGVLHAKDIRKPIEDPSFSRPSDRDAWEKIKAGLIASGRYRTPWELAQAMPDPNGPEFQAVAQGQKQPAELINDLIKKSVPGYVPPTVGTAPSPGMVAPGAMPGLMPGDPDPFADEEE